MTVKFCSLFLDRISSARMAAVVSVVVVVLLARICWIWRAGSMLVAVSVVMMRERSKSMLVKFRGLLVRVRTPTMINLVEPRERVWVRGSLLWKSSLAREAPMTATGRSWEVVRKEPDLRGRLRILLRSE